MTKYYTTADTARMTTQFPVKETLELFAFVSRHHGQGLNIQDRMTGYDVALCALKGSPADHSSVNDLLGQLVTAAARENSWVGIDTGWSLEDLDTLKKNIHHLNSPRIKQGLDWSSPFAQGIARAMDAYLLDFAAADERVYVVPKDGLANFIQRRATALESQIMLP